MLPVPAMHMGNELLSEGPAAVTLVIAGAAVAMAARAARSLDAERLPLMGVMGAFVFAAQMVNFTFMPGVSGHLTGGVLLAILLGPSAAIVTMAAILIIQCLLFQDGGLLALGCNIINMGVVPCLLGWWICKAAARGNGRWRLYLGTWSACVVGVTAGAALVPVEAYVSGVLQVPLLHFLAVVVGLHLAIGCVEGLITVAVVAYLCRLRPDCLKVAAGPSPGPRRRRVVLASLVVAAVVLAGVVSWFASPHPDGLESAADGSVKPSSGLAALADDWLARWAPMADYTRRSASLGRLPDDRTVSSDAGAYPNMDGWGSVAGLAGTAVTLGLVYLVATILNRRARRRA